MGRDKDPRRKSKGISFEKGAPSQPHSAHPTPETGTLIPIPANPENAFPFTARMRMTSAMKERAAKLRDYKVLNPIYPDLGLLSNLDILDAVEKYFVDNGFGFVFESSPPFVYEALVREFVYSFTPEWRVVKRQRSEFCVPEKHVVEWKFRLGGVEHTYSREDLQRAFNLADRITFPYVKKAEYDAFWKLISGGDEDFVPAEPSTKIKLPVWKLVHRFISSCVIMRKDEGRWINKTDIELLCCIHKGLHFDALTPITKTLEEATTAIFKGTYIGGGPFVTMLALDIGFSLDPQFAFPRKLLGEAEMIRRGFLKLERTRHGIYRRLVDRDVFAKEKQAPPTPAPQPPPPQTTQYEFGSSSASQQPVTMEDLSAQLRALTNYTHEGFLWAGDVFTDLYTKMGYEDIPPPPPHPAGTTYSDAPEYTGEEADDDESDEESSDEDDDDDGMDEDTDTSAAASDS